MDFNNLKLFSMIKSRVGWLNQRQRVLSQNIANSDTPGYKPKDLKPMKFREALDNNVMRIEMAKTGPNHLSGRPDTEGPYKEAKERKPYETALAGNAVVLEEQVLKVTKTKIDHQLSNELYRKHLAMFKAALRGR